MSEVGSRKSKVEKNLGFMMIFVIMLSVAVFSGTASAELTATANHDHIQIDFFYHGSTVSVKGVADAGTDLVIKITSPESHQSLRKKGKVAGLLWMNVGELKFEHTPNFYGVYSAKNLDDILSREEMDKYTIGYSSLKNHVEVTPVANDEEKSKWFNEFVKFKEASNLYTSASGKISTTLREDGRQEYYLMTDWPYQATPGDYLVTVYAVKNKKVVEQAEAKVNVEQVGVVKSLAGMAKNKGALYGALSVLAALSAGFGVGLIFRKGGGSH